MVMECLYVVANHNAYQLLRIIFTLRSSEPGRTVVAVYYVTPIFSTCPLHTISRCGKERRILIGMVTCQGSTRLELP